VPLVFVHGVNTRKSAEYDASVRARDAMFRCYCLSAIAGDPDNAKILNPYWGGKAATFPWNYGFAHDTQQKLEAFGAGSDFLDDALRDAGVTPTPVQRTDVIVSVAKQRFADAVDLLWTAAGATGQLSDADAKELAALSTDIQAYVEAQSGVTPSWVATRSSDGQFIEKLLDEVEDWKKQHTPQPAGAGGLQAFGAGGLLNSLKAGATRAADRAADAAFGSFVEGKLPDVLRRFSLFFGDVFEYIKQRSSGTTDIIDIVLDDLRQAGTIKQATGERLVCIGHSMGGDILYDLLTDTSLSNIPDCDLFVTVGSQVGLFEELKMFKSSVKNFPPDPSTRVPVSRRPKIKRWINAFDRSDPFGYPVKTIFEGVEDFFYDTRASSLSAHGAYFLQPTFHERLRTRVAKGP
jgi:hypothetical protein